MKYQYERFAQYLYDRHKLNSKKYSSMSVRGQCCKLLVVFPSLPRKSVEMCSKLGPILGFHVLSGTLFTATGA
jgi:hypothetical protein